ncbi:MAG: TetR/AcrR family transcriptional regulator [Saprospiraceae bacterium]|nr:TetR/AcrR family transcriptional regulator [Saprospiraceae bacterium]
MSIKNANNHGLSTFKDIERPWILVGYSLFAEKGPTGLQVQVMAREVQKSKSSFYHLFADLDVFTEVLLEYHLERSKVIAHKETFCQNLVPDLVNLLLEVKEDLLFNRQLRIHRDKANFSYFLEQSDAVVQDSFYKVWARDIGLEEKPQLARDVFALALENFYLQLTEQNLNYAWLTQYFQELRTLVKQFKR